MEKKLDGERGESNRKSFRPDVASRKCVKRVAMHLIFSCKPTTRSWNLRDGERDEDRVNVSAQML
jgi:hypothetical protein